MPLPLPLLSKPKEGQGRGQEEGTKKMSKQNFIEQREVGITSQRNRVPITMLLAKAKGMGMGEG
jgi:hypothetical protein